MLLYRYIIKEHIFPFLASLGIVVFLFIMQQAILMLDRIVSKDVDPRVVIEVFLIQLGWILALGIPMAILSATLMTFGRMSGDNEITAIKAAGHSMTTLMKPVLAAAAVITVGLFFFHDLILPEANHYASNLLGDISRKRPAAFIEPGVLIRDFPGYTLYTEQVNTKTGDLTGVRIFVDDPGQDPSVTVAEKGNIRVISDGNFIELSLYNGETHSVSRSGGGKDYFIAKFKVQTFHLNNIDTRLERTESGDRGDREMPISEMMTIVRGLKETNASLASEYEAAIDSMRNYIVFLDTVTEETARQIDSSATDSTGAPASFRRGFVRRPPGTFTRSAVSPAPAPAVSSAPVGGSVGPLAGIAGAARPTNNPRAPGMPPPPMRSARAAKLSDARNASDPLTQPGGSDSSAYFDDSAVRFLAWTEDMRGDTRRALTSMRLENSGAGKFIREKYANDVQIAQYMVEVHKKFAIPAACLIFVLIGAPLGIMARRGGLAVGASYSVLFFVIYWVFLISGENKADKLLVSPVVGMWSGNLFLLGCGVVLMILMLRETSISFAFVKNFFGKSAPIFARVSRTWVFKIPGILFKLPKVLLNAVNGRLPTYLTGMFLGYVIGLMIALVVIFVTIDYVSNLNRFENASYPQVLLYYYYYTPWIALTVMPIVLFLSSMFSMGHLAKTSELTAMKAAGVNVRQLTMPLLIFGVVISAAVFFGGEEIIPRANEERRLLRGNFSKDAASIEQARENTTKTVREYRRNFFYFGSPNVMYVFGEFCTEPQFFRRVTRYTFKDDGVAERVEAPEAFYSDSAGWRFENARIMTFDGEMATKTFESLPDTILKNPPPELVKRLRSVDEMSYWELTNFIEAAKRRGEKVQKYMADLEFKIALPFMNFIVILFGLSLAARTGRRGGNAAIFGIGLLLSFMFWILNRFMLVFAQNGFIPITLAAWIGNVIFLVVGLALYRKAAH